MIKKDTVIAGAALLTLGGCAVKVMQTVKKRKAQEETDVVEEVGGAIFGELEDQVRTQE